MNAAKDDLRTKAAHSTECAALFCLELREVIWAQGPACRNEKILCQQTHGEIHFDKKCVSP